MSREYKQQPGKNHGNKIIPLLIIIALAIILLLLNYGMIDFITGLQ